MECEINTILIIKQEDIHIKQEMLIHIESRCSMMGGVAAWGG